MAVQIFDLRGVPDDEAQDIRQLLSAHDINYYETPAGRWGISTPGVWIRDNAQREQAAHLITQYQNERAMQARKHYDEQQARGLAPTLWNIVAQYPLRVVAVLSALVVVLYVSVVPFFRMVGQ